LINKQIKKKNQKINNLMPVSIKRYGVDRIRLTRLSFDEIRMTKIVGRMTEEKAIKHSKVIRVACISPDPKTA
jgi:hypothetical protein